MRLFAVALAWCLALLAPAHAETQRFSLDYAGSAWGLISVGGARLDIELQEDGAYSASGTVRSGGIAALFLRTQIEVAAEGEIDDGSVRWERYSLEHFYDNVHRHINMRPTSATVQASISPLYPDGWGTPPASDAQKRAARDPLSSLIAMANDVGATRRCQGDYMTFDGRWLYRLEVRGGEQHEFESGAYMGPALRCRVRYFPVAGFAPTDQGYRDPPPPGSVWFALIEGERFAPPVRASMPLPLGTAQLTLRAMEMTEDVTLTGAQ
ncbi:MAG: DUF3108 domain-containing protein [Hyphomonadaceae bacterium]|nr:DUF3108 domain-containing protein [Hyphomonadaceae bacterium]